MARKERFAAAYPRPNFAVIYVKIFRTASLILLPLLLFLLHHSSRPSASLPKLLSLLLLSLRVPHLHLPQQQHQHQQEEDGKRRRERREGQSQVFPLTRVLWPFRPNLTARRDRERILPTSTLSPPYPLDNSDHLPSRKSTNSPPSSLLCREGGEEKKERRERRMERPRAFPATLPPVVRSQRIQRSRVLCTELMEA